jgi:RNA polymerase sigma-70 factor (ECF subfamily)
MPEGNTFHTLVDKVRAGDQDAAAQLVRQYEPQLRRLVRMRLTDPQLGRVFDSVDICQSVLANFFVRAANGQFELDTPEQLLRLLVTMARNKLLHLVERYHAARRDQRRLEPDGATALAALAAADQSPSQAAAGKELLAQVRRLFTPEEYSLVDQRTRGRSWADIAADTGGRPEALRKKLARALDRVARQLGLEGEAP